MPKTKDQKKKIVEKLTKIFKEAKSIVFSEVKGLNVADTSELRKQLREEKAGHTVAKLSLIKIALQRAGIKPGKLDFKTQVAISFADDETTAARVLKAFSKKHDQLKSLAGFLEGEEIDAGKVNQLASLPTKQQLLGQLASVLAGPARGLVTVLSGNHRGLVRVLSQVKK